MLRHPLFVANPTKMRYNAFKTKHTDKFLFVGACNEPNRINSQERYFTSIARIPMYQTLDTIIIDTNAKDVAVIANEIKQF